MIHSLTIAKMSLMCRNVLNIDFAAKRLLVRLVLLCRICNFYSLVHKYKYIAHSIYICKAQNVHKLNGGQMLRIGCQKIIEANRVVKCQWEGWEQMMDIKTLKCLDDK